MVDAGWTATWGSQNIASEKTVAQVHDMLSEVRRLYVVDAMQTLDSETTTTRELALAIAAVEFEKEPVHVLNSEYRTVRTNLRHSHLPKLSDIGVIEYNPDRNEIKRGRNFEAVATLRAITTPLLRVGFSPPSEWK